jgi:hypothetical protein
VESCVELGLLSFFVFVGVSIQSRVVIFDDGCRSSALFRVLARRVSRISTTTISTATTFAQAPMIVGRGRPLTLMSVIARWFKDLFIITNIFESFLYYMIIIYRTILQKIQSLERNRDITKLKGCRWNKTVRI